MDNPFAKEPKATTAWLWQVFTGIGLVILLGMHFIANHFIAKGGLRDFADVVAYLRNPIVLVLELLFLVFVTTHGLLGVRAILLDLGFSAGAEQRLSRVLTAVGVLTVGYGLWLTWIIIHRRTPSRFKRFGPTFAYSKSRPVWREILLRCCRRFSSDKHVLNDV